MTIIFALCLPRDEASVPVVRHVCRDAMVTLGVDATCIDEIELAVTEACTNLLKHVAGTTAEYEVSVEVDEARCHISITDRHGDETFDYAAYGLTETEAGAESGRGIFLMRAMVDEFSFEAEPDVGTVVHLVKGLDLEEGSLLHRLVG